MGHAGDGGRRDGMGSIKVTNVLGVERTMPLYQVSGVLVDFDGTLADSDWVWGIVNESFLRSRDIPMPDDYMSTVSALGMLAGCRYTKERFGLAESVQEIRDEWCDIADRLYEERVALFPGAADVVRSVRAAGVPVALVTLNSMQVLRSMDRRLGLTGMFDAMVTEEDLTQAKDSPEAFLLGCERLGISGRDHGSVIVFEDTPISVTTAMGEGFSTYMKLNARREHEDTSQFEDAMFRDWSDVSVE